MLIWFLPIYVDDCQHIFSTFPGSVKTKSQTQLLRWESNSRPFQIQSRVFSTRRKTIVNIPCPRANFHLLKKNISEKQLELQYFKLTFKISFDPAGKQQKLKVDAVTMNDLQRLILLVSLGTFALLLCLPACTEAQPLGLFKFEYDDLLDPSFEADDPRNPRRLSRQQILRRLNDLAMSRSGSGPGKGES